MGFNRYYPDRLKSCQVLQVSVTRLAEYACELMGLTGIKVPNRLLPAQCITREDVMQRAVKQTICGQQQTALATTAHVEVERPMPCFKQV